MSGLSAEQRHAAVREIEILRELDRRHRRRVFFRMFPDETIEDGDRVLYARRGYPRQLEFFRAGLRYRERCFMAANRVGKTVAGAYEMSCHLTGEYPAWWEGRRFSGPVRAWAAGKTNETTRDIVQSELCGSIDRDGPRRSFSGTGAIPGEFLGETTWKQGVSDLADTVKVRHRSGGWSLLGFKAYNQGRGAFEGTAQHVIWLDEEPEMDVYGECVIRTATTNGLIYLTFTPLFGMSKVVQQFLPDDMRPGGRL